MINKLKVGDRVKCTCGCGWKGKIELFLGKRKFKIEWDNGQRCIRSDSDELIRIGKSNPNNGIIIKEE